MAFNNPSMVPDIFIESKIFPTYPNEEDDINPGRFGKRLAEFVKKTLESEGIQVADLYATDYAYELRIDEFSFPVFIITGNIDGESDKFLISVEPKKDFNKKLFKKIPTKDTLKKVITSINQGISKNHEIKIPEPI